MKLSLSRNPVTPLDLDRQRNFINQLHMQAEPPRRLPIVLQIFDIVFRFGIAIPIDGRKSLSKRSSFAKASTRSIAVLLASSAYEQSLHQTCESASDSPDPARQSDGARAMGRAMLPELVALDHHHLFSAPFSNAAAVNPVMPVPTIATSTLKSLSSCGKRGALAVAAQIDSVFCSARMASLHAMLGIASPDLTK